MKKGLIAGLLLLSLPAFALAQTNRSYHYTSIDYTYDVQKDTTVLVEETESYAFVGEYHQAVRDIPHKLLSAITDVSVIDADTNQPLTFSYGKLEKTAPSSWNHYTTYEKNGETYIEWYYDISKTSNPSAHRWTIRYTIHGAVAFYKDHDELYWNLFTTYNVPVDHVDATIKLPGEITLPTASFYTTHNLQYNWSQPDKSSYRFTVDAVPPNESVTFAVGWQKGLINQGAFWAELALTYLLYVLSILFVLGSIAFSLVYWRWQEYQNRGQGTIVPQYEPPENLRPAMMDILLHGTISKRTWAATVIDLAVRGFVTIKEDEPKPIWRQPIFSLGIIFAIFCGIIIWILIVAILHSASQDIITYGMIGLIPIFFIVVFFVLSGAKFSSFFPKEYLIESTEKSLGNTLEDYEQKFLRTILATGNGVFSTKKLKDSHTKAEALYYALQKVEEELDKETASDTKAYIIAPGQFIGIAAIIFFALIPVYFLNLLPPSAMPYLVFFGMAIFSFLIILYAIKGRPRLNKEGHILKEHILGFKMYLETAERYRMQNLTPDMFEKYLPYAIIFKVEKRWAKAFESMSLPPPTWYAGTGYVGGSTSSSGSSGFSSTAFTGAFSASFASAFSSSGAGGASGGGGGAGGGGGGGGGGAS
jgi:uncharacterized membrane protein